MVRYALTKNLDSHIAFIGQLLDCKLLNKVKEISKRFKKLHNQLLHRIMARNFIMTLGIQ